MALVLRAEKKGSYADYLTWQDEGRWELVDGGVYDMTPAPTRPPANCRPIYRGLGAALNGKPCIALIAPTDVVLSQPDVVQPDVLVVCEQNQITRDSVQGCRILWWMSILHWLF